MRRFAFIVLTALTSACAGSAPGPAAEMPAPPPTPEPAPIEPFQAPPPGPYAPGFDAVHYSITLALPDSGSFIRGRTVARVALERPARDTLPLDFTGLAVERVRVNGAPVAYRYGGGKLRVPVPVGARPGDTIAVAVTYHGHPDDGLIIGPNAHGRRAVFADNWPNRARFWFPSIDHPSDKATVSFTIGAPPGWEVIANGVRVETFTADGPIIDGQNVWHWESRAPIPTYTMVIGAMDFAIGEAGDAACGRAPRAADGDRCVDVGYWVFPPDSAFAARLFRRADDMVTFYSKLVAPFPYAKLANVQSATRFGGMENVSAIFYSGEAIAKGTFPETTIAHEIAHQWFGDAVTEADWHHLWLSEGFATYFSALFFEQAEGRERFREIMRANKRAYIGSEAVDRPIVDPSEDNLLDLLNTNNYEKGAWVLHMLRGLLGDSTFFAGIRRYYRLHKHGTALTEDLVRALETVSGRDLGWFFEQWVFEPGYPRYRLDWTWDAEAGEAVVTIAQVQPEAWPTFRMPLVVEFATAEGAVRRTVEVDERRERVRVELPAAPTAVRLDPEGWVLKEVAGRGG